MFNINIINSNININNNTTSTLFYVDVYVKYIELKQVEV